MNHESNKIDYKKFKYNIIGSKTREDALYILNKYKLIPLDYNLLMSYINAKKYDLAFDNMTMIRHIKELHELRYKEDVYEIINNLLHNTTDVAQIKTFIRIANCKPSRPQHITLKELKQRISEHVIIKKCPHCNHKCSTTKESYYVICGYNDTDNGYDWQGCGNDWCFKCGKLLCKNWNRNDLFLITNRIHDDKCCRRHAKEKNKIYPNNYCMCKNIYIHRNNDPLYT
jgi:hypothetical protein